MVSDSSLPKAVCLLHINDTGQVLAVSRPGRPDVYALPGGKVEPGESNIQAVMREVLEETNLYVKHPIEVLRGVCKGEVDYDTTYFMCRKLEGELVAEEGINVAYVDLDVVLSGPFGDNIKSLLKATGVLPFDNGLRVTGWDAILGGRAWAK